MWTPEKYLRESICLERAFYNLFPLDYKLLEGRDGSWHRVSSPYIALHRLCCLMLACPQGWLMGKIRPQRCFSNSVSMPSSAVQFFPLSALVRTVGWRSGLERKFANIKSILPKEVVSTPSASVSKWNEYSKSYRGQTRALTQSKSWAPHNGLQGSEPHGPTHSAVSPLPPSWPHFCLRPVPLLPLLPMAPRFPEPAPSPLSEHCPKVIFAT